MTNSFIILCLLQKLRIREFVGRQIYVELPELGDYPFNFSSVCWNVPEPSPIVGLDREISECEKTKNSSTSIANKNV